MLSNVHWLGHASFKLTGERVIYIDPWQIGGGETADIILITHGHYDHCSPEDVAKIRSPKTAVVAAEGCEKLGGEVQVVKPGDRLTVQGIAIEAVPAYNIGKTFHPRQDNGVGYIVTVNGQRIYHAGDSDHTLEMDAVRADVVLLPIGGTYTMTASEAAAAANAIRPTTAVPMHWGRIIGGREDVEQFQRLCQAQVQVLEEEK
ncbi:MAG TPA: MBL fold metallo-hydrolase [Anaerolineae bacterium]|mgnify:CR=1 FL=1|nr:MBL fold metallo-hydrolase [Anaerolineae bacterium]HOR00787.1 MBL fold metallo-hydrolase [Anaerolineae bacterium]HPL28126.1 MBL fold metallo-hydrolase [Anaerolineae bacterium]